MPHIYALPQELILNILERLLVVDGTIRLRGSRHLEDTEFFVTARHEAVVPYTNILRVSRLLSRLGHDILYSRNTINVTLVTRDTTNEDNVVDSSRCKLHGLNQKTSVERASFQLAKDDRKFLRRFKNCNLQVYFDDLKYSTIHLWRICYGLRESLVNTHLSVHFFARSRGSFKLRLQHVSPFQQLDPSTFIIRHALCEARHTHTLSVAAHLQGSEAKLLHEVKHPVFEILQVGDFRRKYRGAINRLWREYRFNAIVRHILTPLRQDVLYIRSSLPKLLSSSTPSDVASRRTSPPEPSLKGAHRQDQSSLLRLGRDLRERIWQLLLVSPKIIDTKVSPDPDSDDNCFGGSERHEARVLRTLYPEICQTCKLLYQETSNILYGQNTFNLTLSGGSEFQIRPLPVLEINSINLDYDYLNQGNEHRGIFELDDNGHFRHCETDEAMSEHREVRQIFLRGRRFVLDVRGDSVLGQTGLLRCVRALSPWLHSRLDYIEINYQCDVFSPDELSFFNA